jgi:hypothetical protein
VNGLTHVTTAAIADVVRCGRVLELDLRYPARSNANRTSYIAARFGGARDHGGSGRQAERCVVHRPVNKAEYSAKARVLVLAHRRWNRRGFFELAFTIMADGPRQQQRCLGRYLMDNIGGPDVSGYLPQLRDRTPVDEDGKAGGVTSWRIANQRSSIEVHSFVCTRGRLGRRNVSVDCASLVVMAASSRRLFGVITRLP